MTTTLPPLRSTKNSNHSTSSLKLAMVQLLKMIIMPKRIEDAKIALLNCPLEIEKTEMRAEVRISDP
jgi:chaperonin GroEL (HSP60 family)